MPGGVQTRFLQVLELDHEMAGRRSILTAVLAVALIVPAWFLSPPWGAAVFLVALGIGLGIGIFVSRSRASRYEASIKDHWTHWMRFATACETVREIHARVKGDSTRNGSAWAAALLTLLWALQVVLVAMAFQSDADLLLVAPLLAVDGLLVGGLMGFAFHQRRWYQGFHASIQDLVESGEIGVWGVL